MPPPSPLFLCLIYYIYPSFWADKERREEREEDRKEPERLTMSLKRSSQLFLNLLSCLVLLTKAFIITGSGSAPFKLCTLLFPHKLYENSFYYVQWSSSSSTLLPCIFKKEREGHLILSVALEHKFCTLFLSLTLPKSLPKFRLIYFPNCDILLALFFSCQFCAVSLITAFYTNFAEIIKNPIVSLSIE